MDENRFTLSSHCLLHKFLSEVQDRLFLLGLLICSWFLFLSKPILCIFPIVFFYLTALFSFIFKKSTMGKHSGTHL